MITISKISKWYGKIQVLKNCSAEVAKGEVVVVCGPSGSGKSTLIKCVNALEPFQEGTITVEGISVGDPKTNLPKLRARIGMVFQHFELFPHLSVIRNLTLSQIKVLGRDPKAAAEKARNFERVDSVHAQKISRSTPLVVSSSASPSRGPLRWIRSRCCLRTTSALDPK
jgi:glutamate/aspartate transport system ATP-binding protein